MEKRYFTSDLKESLIASFSFLDGDDFDIGSDIVLAAEVEHLLRFFNTADGRARKVCGGP